MTSRVSSASGAYVAQRQWSCADGVIERREERLIAAAMRTAAGPIR